MKNILSLIEHQQKTSVVCGQSYFDYKFMELERCLDYSVLGEIANIWGSFSNFLRHNSNYM